MAKAKVVVLYNTPQDPQAFDQYYASRHIEIAKKIPGVRSYRISNGPVATPQGPSPYHLVATLEFDSMQALQAGMGSAEGRAAGGDLPNFATGGASLLIFEERDA